MSLPSPIDRRGGQRRALLADAPDDGEARASWPGARARPATTRAPRRSRRAAARRRARPATVIVTPDPTTSGGAWPSAPSTCNRPHSTSVTSSEGGGPGSTDGRFARDPVGSAELRRAVRGPALRAAASRSGATARGRSTLRCGRCGRRAGRRSRSRRWRWSGRSRGYGTSRARARRIPDRRRTGALRATPSASASVRTASTGSGAWPPSHAAAPRVLGSRYSRSGCSRRSTRSTSWLFQALKSRSARSSIVSRSMTTSSAWVSGVGRRGAAARRRRCRAAGAARQAKARRRPRCHA